MPTTQDADVEEGKLYPIREVARLTGVNAVTLRAWERRYGLLVPMRTPKGHRLYGNDHLEKIKKITNWIKKGVAVSKVADLLSREETQDIVLDSVENWQNYQHEFIAAAQAFNEDRLTEVYNHLLSIYPVDDVLDKFFRPVLEKLRARWREGVFGAQLEKAFIEGSLMGGLYTKLSYEKKHVGKTSILLARLPEHDSDIDLLLLALSAVARDIHCCCLTGPFNLKELPLLVEQHTLSAVVLYGEIKLSERRLGHDLPRLKASLAAPVAIFGGVVSIHQDALIKAVDYIPESPMSYSLGNLIKKLDL